MKEFLALLDSLPMVRAVLAFLLVFFLPGLVWSFVFLRRLNFIERVVFSLALSIALVTLSLFSANRLLGMRLSGFNSALVITVVTILPVFVYYLNKVIQRGRRLKG